MDRYAIIKDGRDFIVKSGEVDVFKCTSRRKAAKIIADANGLMRADSAASQARDNEPCDQTETQGQITRSSLARP